MSVDGVAPQPTFQPLRAAAGIAVLCSAYLRQRARAYADLSELEFFMRNSPTAEIDLLASSDDLVSIGEAKTTPSLGTRRERASKAKKLAMVAQVLQADQVLLCTSSTNDWPDMDIKAVQKAIGSAFADAPGEPMTRIITGLGTPDVKDDLIL